MSNFKVSSPKDKRSLPQNQQTSYFPSDVLFGNVVMMIGLQCTICSLDEIYMFPRDSFQHLPLHLFVTGQLLQLAGESDHHHPQGNLLQQSPQKRRDLQNPKHRDCKLGFGYQFAFTQFKHLKDGVRWNVSCDSRAVSENTFGLSPKLFPPKRIRAM